MSHALIAWVEPEHAPKFGLLADDEIAPDLRQNGQSRFKGVTLLHEWAIWRPKLEGIGGLDSPDPGSLSCRSRPMPIAVIVSPSSGTG